MERTGCNGTSNTLQCLRNLTTAELQAQNTNFPVPGGVGTPIFMYTTTIDGGLITDYTYRLFAENKFIQVPTIFGDTTNEGTIFTPKNTSSYQDMNIFLLTQYPHLNQTQLEQIDAYYPKDEQFPNSGPYWRTAANAYGEIRYICPGQYCSSQTQSAGGPSWNYRYNVMDPTLEALGLGTTHTQEVNAIWGPQNVNGAAPASYNTTNYPIVPVLQGYWTSFIRSYDPNMYRAPGTPTWEQWTDAGKQRIMFITNGTMMETVPDDQVTRCAYAFNIAISLQQ